MKVLFVCTGNMCRSPMAMFMLRAELQKRGIAGIDVDSAGTMKHEKPMTSFAVQSLDKHNVPHDEYGSKFVSKDVFDGADFVFAMTEGHKLIIESMYGASKKVLPMSKFLGHEISDPYGLGEAAYEQTYQELKLAIPKILDFLTKQF
ncbi:MAG: hypothetical protein II867_01035 [Clostridia bacterium]|nr:hypothetical protein [Clostridia bacterium]